MRVAESGEKVIVRPWYRQFYLRRGEAEWSSHLVSDEGYSAGLEAIDGFAYVATTMYGSPTEVVLRIHSSEPEVVVDADRVAETILGGEGDVAVHNWDTDGPPTAIVRLHTGEYHVRAAWCGSAQAEAHPDYDIGGELLAPEHIVLDFWPAA
jgi:hypothetical protein